MADDIRKDDKLPRPMKPGPSMQVVLTRFKDLKSLLRKSIPLRTAMRYLGLRTEAMCRVLKQRPDLADELRGAESEGVVENLDVIKEASKKYWQAAAWLLERRYPTEFSLRARYKDAAGNPVEISIVTAVPRPDAIMERRNLGPDGDVPLPLMSVEDSPRQTDDDLQAMLDAPSESTGQDAEGKEDADEIS